MLSLALQCRKGNYKLRPVMAAIVAIQELNSDRGSGFANVIDQSNRSSGHNRPSPKGPKGGRKRKIKHHKSETLYSPKHSLLKHLEIKLGEKAIQAVSKIKSDSKNCYRKFTKQLNCLQIESLGLAAKQIQLLAASQLKMMNKEVNSNNSAAPVETSISQKLMKQFSPVYLEVVNESYMHNVPKGAETHFKVVVVSDKFADLPLIKRHRMVNEALQEELCSGVHALSIMAKTPEQWESNNEVSPSPACRGGFGK